MSTTASTPGKRQRRWVGGLVHATVLAAVFGGYYGVLLLLLDRGEDHLLLRTEKVAATVEFALCHGCSDPDDHDETEYNLVWTAAGGGDDWVRLTGSPLAEEGELVEVWVTSDGQVTSRYSPLAFHVAPAILVGVYACLGMLWMLLQIVKRAFPEDPDWHR